MTLPMTSFVAIDASFHWIRTALVENGVLTDVYEESPERGRLKGNIYKGVVRRIDTKIHAAFIRYGQGRDGFLPLKDAERTGQGVPVSKSLKEGDEVLVQVLKDEVGEKGAALTTRLSLSGRALVYLLEKEGEGGVSSRLSEEDRTRLRAVLQELKVPEGSGVILRTAALAKSPTELQADLDRLALLEKEIRDAFNRRRDPGLLWREAPPITRYLREYWQKTFDQVMVNTEEAYAECRAFFSQHEPEDLHKVVLSPHGPALFERLGLEETLAKLDATKVALPSGANIVIERTEALVSIDVNSARSKNSGASGDGRTENKAEANAEENLFRINCEAAAEVARQIRLRDLGGIIVVDFIDLEDPRHRAELETLMKTLCARDKAKVKVYGLSPLGLMEINRQRLRKIPETRELPLCPTCHGHGHLEGVEGQALKALRLLAARLSERPGEEGATLTLSAEIATRLWNEHRQDIEDLEQRFATRIRLQVQTGPASGMAFHWSAGAKTLTRAAKPQKQAGAKPNTPAASTAPVRTSTPTVSTAALPLTVSTLPTAPSPASKPAAMPVQAAKESGEKENERRKQKGPQRDSSAKVKPQNGEEVPIRKMSRRRKRRGRKKKIANPV